MPQSGSYPNTLNAITSGNVQVAQASGEFLNTKILSGNNTIGTVNTKPPIWSLVQFTTLVLNIPSATAAATWVDGAFEQTYSGYQFIKLIPIIDTAASMASTNVDLRFAWSADATPNSRGYIVNETLGTPAAGLVAVTQSIKYWTIPVSTLGIIANPIILPVQGTWLQVQGRRNLASTTNVSVSFNAQLV